MVSNDYPDGANNLMPAIGRVLVSVVVSGRLGRSVEIDGAANER